jgi:hypothetical protein
MSATSWEQTMLESQRDYVTRQLQAGVPLETVADDLARMGIDVARARQFVASIGPQVAPAASAAGPWVAQPAFAYAGATQPTPMYRTATTPATPRVVRSDVGASIFGAAVAAGLGVGLLMGVVAMAANLKFGLAASPVGVAVALTVRRAGGRGAGDALVAVFVGTALGVTLQRFLAFVQAVHDVGKQVQQFAQANNIAVTASFSRAALIRNPEMYSGFVHHIGAAFGFAGLLSLVIGLFVAARIVTAD